MPAGMPLRLLLEEWFAESYHYTPEQVGELSLDALEWFPVIAEAKARATKIRSEQERRPGGGRGRR